MNSAVDISGLVLILVWVVMLSQVGLIVAAVVFGLQQIIVDEQKTGSDEAQYLTSSSLRFGIQIGLHGRVLQVTG